MKTIAVVVTYNRKILLQECLDALLSQNIPVDKILVINNASTDGTEQLFKNGSKYDLKQINCFNMESNLGGAGGFSEGLKIAANEDCDWVWIMDDDTIPTPNALEEFKNSIEALENEKISFLASSVFGAEGEPMNVPLIWNKPFLNGYEEWYRNLGNGMVRIKAATFVSLLVNINAIKNVGVPFAEYFIWGDDIEYTRRLTTYYGSAYMCGKSQVIHKRFNAKALSIEDEDNESRINNYFYLVRNNLINCKEYDGNKKARKMAWEYFKTSVKMLIKSQVKFRWKKFFIVQKGICDFRLKKYNYKKFDNRLKYFKG